MIHLKAKGFTLIELMIVVAIIGVLAAMKAAKVRLIASAEGVDTADDGGERGLLDVAGLFAGYLRFAKRERIAAGQQRARQAGVRFWPPSSAAQPAPEGSGGFGCWCRRPRGRQDRGDQPDERAPGSRPDARGRDAAG